MITKHEIKKSKDEKGNIKVDVDIRAENGIVKGVFTKDEARHIVQLIDNSI